MEPEIELELFAALCADVEAGRPLADVLRAEGLLESTWAQSRDAWMGRMSHGADAERKALEERYLVAFHARKRLTGGHFSPSSIEDPTTEESAEFDEPPTRRAAKSTIILIDDAPRNAVFSVGDASRSNDHPRFATPPMGTVPPPVEAPASATSSTFEETLPLGTAAPNLSAARRLPSPEHTPPMGVAAPNLAELSPERPAARLLANSEHTPPMGVAAPNLADPSPRSRRTPEPTPPMRPRSDFISDEAARVAAEAVNERKTDPPPPVPSRPALPFPPSPQAPPTATLPAPMPSASAPFRPPSVGGSYPAPPPPPAAAPQAPAPAPIAPPMQFPQASAQAPAPTGYGSYPSMMALAAQGAAPTAASSSPGFSPPTKSAGPPLALGGFSATSSGPRMKLEVYAAFAAEIAVKPVEVAEIRERYGLTDVAHTAEDEAWQRRFSSDRDTYVRYAKLFQHYRDWFSGRTPR